MARLNYHHLHYFWAVAKNGNLTKTAQHLNVSQSALSSQIRQLENTMETVLFEREGRKLKLTEAGQHALTYAEDIFSKGNELESLLRTGIASTVSTLRIGTLATMSRNFVESFIEPLIQRADVSYSLHARNQTSLLNDLCNHQLDVGLSNIEVLSSDKDMLQSQLLARQPVSIIGPPKLGLDTNNFSKDYHHHKWVLPSGDSPIRTAFDSFCAQHEFWPTITAEADDMAMLRLLARDSGALAVLPNVVVKDELSTQHLVSYMELPNIYENFFAVSVKRQYSHRLVNELLSKHTKIAS
ncbi:MAG: LysR family transcriptional activator of nhaA [Cellvibrionaceae bacterium]|jgi:LysR family transcriptional activator of nhaA